MMIFKSHNNHNNVTNEKTHFKNLGKELAKKTITNLRKEIRELSE